jgi:hypothetical protein
MSGAEAFAAGLALFSPEGAGAGVSPTGDDGGGSTGTTTTCDGSGCSARHAALVSEMAISQAMRPVDSMAMAVGPDVETVRIVAGHEDLKTTAQHVHGRVDDARRAMGAGPLVGDGA